MSTKVVSKIKKASATIWQIDKHLHDQHKTRVMWHFFLLVNIHNHKHRYRYRYIYVYIYMYRYRYIYINVYIYIERERYMIYRPAHGNIPNWGAPLHPRCSFLGMRIQAVIAPGGGNVEKKQYCSYQKIMY